MHPPQATASLFSQPRWLVPAGNARPDASWELWFSRTLTVVSRQRGGRDERTTGPGVPRDPARKEPSAVGGGGRWRNRRAAMAGQMAVLGKRRPRGSRGPDHPSGC